MAAAPVIVAGVAVAGLGMSVYGQLSNAAAQAAAAKRTAALKNQEADEILAREQINEGVLQTEFGRNVSEYQTQWGGNVGEGAGIGGVLRMQKDFGITIANAQRDAAFKARMLRAGADIETSLASDQMAAGYYNAGGTVLTQGSKVYQYLNAQYGTSNSQLPGSQASISTGPQNG